jgi:hypothetical protein
MERPASIYVSELSRRGLARRRARLLRRRTHPYLLLGGSAAALALAVLERMFG